MSNMPNKNLVVYQAPNGAIELKGDVTKETIWASQTQIAEIFGVDRTVVTKHIRNIFKDEELDKKVVCAKFAHTTKHGALENKSQTREILFINDDTIHIVSKVEVTLTTILYRVYNH